MHLRLRNGESGRVWQMREQGYNLIQGGQEGGGQTQVHRRARQQGHGHSIKIPTLKEKTKRERERERERERGREGRFKIIEFKNYETQRRQLKTHFRARFSIYLQTKE